MMHDGQQIGECAVDSGQIMIIDPCYVLPDEEREMEEVLNEDTGCMEEVPKRHTVNYNQLLKIRGYVPENTSEMKKNFHEYQSGIVCDTLYGDGSYPVYATYEGSRIRTLTIDFGSDDEEEEADDY